MEVYNYHNESVKATPEEIFAVINDDEKLKDILSIVSKIEYYTKNKRSRGTKFRAVLNVRAKTYRFRNEITEYVEDRRITVTTKLKQGNLITTFNVVPDGSQSELTVRTTLEEAKMGTKIFIKSVKPIIKVVLNRELKKFEEYI